jgi:hypothetical protein
VARLVKVGVPFDKAWDMKPMMKLAWLVADGENDGGEFDWQAMRWKKP